MVQEEEGAQDEAVAEAVAHCVEKGWFENGLNIKTLQEWMKETEVEPEDGHPGDEYTWKHGVKVFQFIVDLPHDKICELIYGEKEKLT